MNAIKIIKQLKGTNLNIKLPQSFNNKEVEIIISNAGENKTSAELITFNEFTEYKQYRKSLPKIDIKKNIDRLTDSINNDIF